MPTDTRRAEIEQRLREIRAQKHIPLGRNRATDFFLAFLELLANERRTRRAELATLDAKPEEPPHAR